MTKKTKNDPTATSPNGSQSGSTLTGQHIVVLDRGFVYVGDTRRDGDFLIIENARNIRRWGTTEGLGQLASGPTAETILDDAGLVTAPIRSVIHLIACTRAW